MALPQSGQASPAPQRAQNRTPAAFSRSHAQQRIAAYLTVGLSS
jgi:hypothetical protein